MFSLHRFIFTSFLVILITVSMLLLAGNSFDTSDDDKSSIYNSSDFDSKVEADNTDTGIEKYKEAIHTTDEEKRMLYCIVEMEAHGLSYYHKQLITCVVLNRVDSELFKESSIYDVLTAKNQFSSLFNYYDTKFEPGESTIKAVDSILQSEVEDYHSFSKGAIFFYNPSIVGYKSFFENRTFLYEIEGHRFFS